MSTPLSTPQVLSDLVEVGYLRELPVDPFTGSNGTWVEVYENSNLMLPTQTAPGIVDVQNGSNLASVAGEPYNTWQLIDSK